MDRGVDIPWVGGSIYPGFSKRIEVGVSIYKVGGRVECRRHRPSTAGTSGVDPERGVPPLSGRRGHRCQLLFGAISNKKLRCQ